MARFQLTRHAQIDLLQIWNYLAEQAGANVAKRVANDLRDGIRKVARSPKLGHRREDLVAADVWFFRVHSYLIIYQRADEGIIVVRVLHGARDVAAVLSETRIDPSRD